MSVGVLKIPDPMVLPMAIMVSAKRVRPLVLADIKGKAI
jgi:hypothetical protein